MRRSNLKAIVDAVPIESNASAGRSLRTRNNERRLRISSSPELLRNSDLDDEEYSSRKKAKKTSSKVEGSGKRAKSPSKKVSGKSASSSARNILKIPAKKNAKTRKSNGSDSGIGVGSSCDESLDPEDILRIQNYRFKQLFLTDTENESDSEDTSVASKSRLPSAAHSVSKSAHSKNRKATKRQLMESTSVSAKKMKPSNSEKGGAKPINDGKKMDLNPPMNIHSEVNCAQGKDGDFQLIISVEEPCDGRPWSTNLTEEERKDIARQRIEEEKLKVEKMNAEFQESRNVETLSDDLNSSDILDVSMLGATNLYQIFEVLAD